MMQESSMQTDRLPQGAALFAFGLGVAVVTFLSLAQGDVGLVRSQWSALLSMLLAAPVLVSWALRGGTLGEWTRAFWTAALAAYLLHFWWAVFGTFRGDFGAIIERQGAVAYSNFLVTALWLADVLLCWWPRRDEPRWQLWLQTGNRWLVFISFTAAGVIFRSGTVRLIGVVLLLGVAVALYARFTRPASKAAALPEQEPTTDLSQA